MFFLKKGVLGVCLKTCFQKRNLNNRNLRREGRKGGESCSGHISSLIFNIITDSGVRRWVKKGRTRRPSKDEKKTNLTGFLLRLCWFEYFFKYRLNKLYVEYSIRGKTGPKAVE